MDATAIKTPDTKTSASFPSTRLRLSKYELIDLQWLLPRVWQCDKSILIEWYRQHTSNNHLDLGAGTGYFLGHCAFSNDAKLTLLDYNLHCLEVCQKRLGSIKPVMINSDLQHGLPEDLENQVFSSIGMNMLLQHLPGEFHDKGKLFDEIKQHLEPGGTVFGSTLLGRGAARGTMARHLLKRYNKKGLLHNLFDSPRDLYKTLDKYFPDFAVRVEGSIALFSASTD